MMEYHYMSLTPDTVDEVLAKYAEEGWRVHTFTPMKPGADLHLRVLLERSNNKCATTTGF